MQARRLVVATMVVSALLVGSGCGKERSEHAAAVKANTEAAYEAFLQRFPDGARAEDAKTRLAALAFERTKADGSFDAYDRYARRYPESVHKAEVQERLEELGWERAKKRDTAAVYRHFIERHPESVHVGEARAKLEQEEYLAAVASDTKSGFSAFLKAYPSTKYKVDIEQRLEWLDVEARHERKAFEGYLAAHPDSKYAATAKLRLRQYDLWDQTAPLRERFLGELPKPDLYELRKQEPYVKYAVDLTRANLLDEARAVLAGLQYHVSQAPMRYLADTLGSLDSLDVDGDNLGALRAQVQKMENAQRASKVAGNVSYVDVVEALAARLAEGEIRTDERQLLALMLASAKGKDQGKLDRIVQSSQFGTLRPVFPAFSRAVAAVILGADRADADTVRIALTFRDLDAARQIVKGDVDHTAPKMFKYLYYTIARVDDAGALALLDGASGGARANVVVALGLAERRSALEPMKRILASTSDPRLRLVCLASLGNLGEDHTPELDDALRQNLDAVLPAAGPVGSGQAASSAASASAVASAEAAPAAASPSASSSAAAPGGDGGVAPVTLVQDVLILAQWLKSGDNNRIDLGLVERALRSDNSTVQYFALAILTDREAKLSAESAALVANMLGSESESTASNARDFFEARQEQQWDTLQRLLAEGSEAQKIAVVGLLDKEKLGGKVKEARDLVCEMLPRESGKLLDALLLAAGRFQCTEQREVVARSASAGGDGHAAAVALVALDSSNSAEAVRVLKSASGTGPKVALLLAGDAATIGALKTDMRSGSIQDRATAVMLSSLVKKPEFFPDYYSLLTYRNAAYAPTDYVVVHSAQTAAIETLLANQSLRW